MTDANETADPATRDGCGGEATVPVRTVVGYCLAIMSVATAVIHFAVAGTHFQQYWVFGVFMLAVAWLQLGWAVTVPVRPSRTLWYGGALLNAGVIVVYVVTRTVGDVIGPTPHEVEPFGFGDGFCTALEAAIVVGCVFLLAATRERRVTRRRIVTATAGITAVTAILLSVSLVAGGPEMVMTMGGNAGTNTMPMTAPGPSIKLPTTSPAGDITMPDPGMQMAPGMKMASSSTCTTAPSTAQQNAAVTLVDTSWAGASKYQSLAAAKAAGYRPITPTGAAVVHYLNPAYYRATVLGGPVLNTAQPQSLVYANTPHGAVLAAAMYISAPGGPTPQPGGCLTQWHVHTNLCVSKTAGVVAEADPNCPAGSRNRVTPPMMHVWYVPIPGGPTAVDATDTQVVHAAEQVTAPVNTTA
jgi:hypothetical protein